MDPGDPAGDPAAGTRRCTGQDPLLLLQILQTLWSTRERQQLREEAWRGFAALDDPLAGLLDMLESSRGRRREGPSLEAWISHQLQCWLRAQPHPGPAQHSPRLEQLQARAVRVLTESPLSLAAPLASIFQLQDADRSCLLEHVHRLYHEGRFREAVMLGTTLKLQPELDVEKMSVPLLLQDKVALVERYVAGFPDLQRRLLALMDSWCQPGFDIKDVARQYPQVASLSLEKLSPKVLSRQVLRLQERFGMVPALCPHAATQQRLAALQHLCHKRFMEKSLSQENWADHVQVSPCPAPWGCRVLGSCLRGTGPEPPGESGQTEAFVGAGDPRPYVRACACQAGGGSPGWAACSEAEGLGGARLGLVPGRWQRPCHPNRPAELPVWPGGGRESPERCGAWARPEGGRPGPPSASTEPAGRAADVLKNAGGFHVLSSTWEPTPGKQPRATGPEASEGLVGQSPWLQEQLSQLLASLRDPGTATQCTPNPLLPEDQLPATVAAELGQLQLQGRAAEADSKPDVKEVKDRHYQLPIPRENVYLLASREDLARHEGALLQPQQVVAVDLEWTPVFVAGGRPRPSLLQVAMEGHVFLLDIQALTQPPAGQGARAFSQLVTQLLSDPSITKLGYGMAGDLQKLGTSCPALAHVEKQVLGGVDLLLVHRQMRVAGMPTPGVDGAGGLRGLSLLVQQVLGTTLDKTQQLSNWDRRPLCEEKLIYAAADAYCLLEVHQALCREPARFHLSGDLAGSQRPRHRERPGTEEPPSLQDASASAAPRQVPVAVTEATIPQVPARAFRVVCDNMLQGLARSLRCLGVDAQVLRSSEDHRRAAESSLQLVHSCQLCQAGSGNRTAKDGAVGGQGAEMVPASASLSCKSNLQEEWNTEEAEDRESKHRKDSVSHCWPEDGGGHTRKPPPAATVLPTPDRAQQPHRRAQPPTLRFQPRDPEQIT
nr:exonuclease mut-7 homolog isoform X2 [Saimiri boliviensis boliviensis]